MAKKRTARQPKRKVAASSSPQMLAMETIYGRLAEYPWTSHFFYVHGVDGVFTYVSPSIAEVLGFTPGEFSTHYTRYLTDHPLNEEARRRTELSIKGVQQPPYEVEACDKKGVSKRLLVHEFPIKNDKGRVICVAGIAWDITDQRRLEEELRQSEEKYRALVETASEAIFTVDRDGRFLFLNAAAAREVGGKPEDYIGKTLWDIFPKEMADRYVADIRQVIDNKCDLVFAEAESVLQGEERWYHTTIKPISGPAGKAVALLIARDITQRKKAEELLRQSEARHRYLLENLNDIFFACDREGILTYISPQIQRYGIKPEEAIGRSIFDLIAEEDRVETQREFSRAMATHEHRSTRFRFRDARGEIYWFEESSREIRSETGEAVGLMGMIRDVSARVRVEEELRLSEEKYRSVVDNVDIGIAVISPAMQIVTINKKMQEWFPDISLEAKPICYRAFNNPPRAEVCAYCPVVLTLRDGKVHCSVTETSRGNATANYRIVASPLRNAQGEVTAVIELVEDITAERSMSERLAHAERLAALGTLAAGVAHEFNNLNVGVLGFADLALTNAEINPELRLCLERIRNAARRARSLTTNLLGLASAREVRRSRGNLRPVISETVDLIWQQLEAAGVDIEMRLHPVPDTAMDAGQIGQIILNLLSNAKKAMKNSPEKLITVETGVQGNRIFVRIADTGCGIPPENLSRIFEPFFSTCRAIGEEGGSGLGLCVSRMIAESHGGSLEVESEVGKGAAFTLWLPIEEASPLATSCWGDGGDVSLFGVRVLIIDDDPDTADLLHIFLSRECLTVVAERDVDTGMRRLQEEDFDVAIVDIMMPGLGGEDFLRSLQPISAPRRPTVIVLTGCAERRVHEACLRLGAAEVIAKPFELEEMLKCLKRVVRQRQTAAPGDRS